MKTIEEAKAAVERGETVHWKNSGYTLRKDKRGEWWVDCCNGFVTPLNGHKPEDFHAANAGAVAPPPQPSASPETTPGG